MKNECILSSNTAIGVVGLGISGKGVLSYAKDIGVKNVTVRDEKNVDVRGIPPFPSTHVYVGNGYLDEITEDVLFVSPGVRRDWPALQTAKARGVRLSSDAELFFAETESTVFAVTGSDGKSTTCHLAEALLQGTEFSSATAIGNIGRALSPYLLTKTKSDALVTELSSFQLNDFVPKCKRALITNITPNHLNFHGSMQAYIEAKSHILSACEEPVCNLDDETVRTLFAEKPVSIGYTMHPVSNIRPDVLIHQDADGVLVNGKRLFSWDRFPLCGRHNRQNLLAALSLTYGYWKGDALDEAMSQIQGLPHRCEFVRTLRGVRFLDSSVDSSPSRTLATLRSLSCRPILLLCGRGKHLPTDIFAKDLASLSHIVITFGEFGKEMFTILKESGDFTIGKTLFAVADMTEAISTALSVAESGDTVLLSPAATGFDTYKNFAERGRDFVRIVQNLI